jgi:hypothetical protein
VFSRGLRKVKHSIGSPLSNFAPRDSSQSEISAMRIAITRRQNITIGDYVSGRPRNDQENIMINFIA